MGQVRDLRLGHVVQYDEHVASVFHLSILNPLCVCSAWAILLNRFQTRLQIVLIPPALFIPVVDDAVERQRLLEAVPDSVAPFIIYEETTDIWINVGYRLLRHAIGEQYMCGLVY